MPSESSVPPQTTLRTLLGEAWPDISTILDLVEDERVRCACFRLEKRFIDSLAILDDANHLQSSNPRMAPGERVALIPDPLVAGLSPSREPRHDEVAVIRDALAECAETNEIALAEHHLDYLANWAAQARGGDGDTS